MLNIHPPVMGDIDRVSGVHLVQLENRQLEIENFKKYFFFILFKRYLFLLLGDMAK